MDTAAQDAGCAVTAADVRRAAAELYGDGPDALRRLAEALGVGRRTVQRWAAGSAAVPAGAARDMQALGADLTAAGGRRDRWLLATAAPAPAADGSPWRRRHLLHTRTPVFRCRIGILARAGDGPDPPEPPSVPCRAGGWIDGREEPFDQSGTIARTAFAALAGFDWTDPPPAGEALATLLWEAAEAADALLDDAGAAARELEGSPFLGAFVFDPPEGYGLVNWLA